jgi:phosphate transport system substrate-binding protein
MARVRNRAGRFVAPSLDALDRAARTVTASDVASVSLVESTDEEAYPITALSFVVVPKDATDHARAEALAKFLWWAIHDGQRFANTLEYAPLPPPLVARGERALRELRADGRPLLPGSG